MAKTRRRPSKDESGTAMGKAWDAVSKTKLEIIFDRYGAVRDGKTLRIAVLDGEVMIDPSKKITEWSLPEATPLLDIIALHYLAGLAQLDETAIDTDWTLFRHMPGGESFQLAFQERVIDQIAKLFSNQPEDLVQAGKGLNGTTLDFGSATIILHFFPRLPVRITVWQGDDEIPGNATMLFPAYVSELLPTEDLVEIADVIVASLKRRSFNSAH